MWNERALAALALVAGIALGCAPAKPTNVLLISIDTLRADRLGCYGYDRPTSPALDALARDGTLFEKVVATSPWTVPSHASIFTGRFPHAHGVVSERDRLADDIPVLAELLRARGMRTAAVVQTTWLSKAQGFARGFDSFQQIPDHAEGGVLVTRGGEAFLRAFSTQPFFLFLHYYDVHSEYRPRPRYEEQFAAGYDGPVDGTAMQLQEIRERYLVLSPRDREHLSSLYDAEIRQLDDALAGLFATLDELGVRDETLVVVTSDHGEEFLEHGNVLHGRTMYREVLDVPLIVTGPGVPRGERVASLASLADVLPTILGRLGLPLPEAIDGVDLFRPALASPTERRVVAAGDHNNTEPDSLRMIQDLRHKLIVDRVHGEARLFDLERDPGEHQDVSAQNPERTAELRRELDTHVERRRQAPERSALTEEEKERLRSLGYLQP